MPKSQNTTSAAWTIFRKMELESGRKFSAADRKGKESKWAEAMQTACQLVATEIDFGLTAEAAMCRVNRLAGLALRRAESNKAMEPYLAKAAEEAKKISAASIRLIAVPVYNEFSLNWEERSDVRRKAHNRAVEHNRAVIMEATEEQLTPEQAAEAKWLDLRKNEYLSACLWAESKGMSVKEWCLYLEVEEAKMKENARVDLEQSHLAWLTEQNNKKVAAMRSRYARRRY
jgi:hypothetical protein